MTITPAPPNKTLGWRPSQSKRPTTRLAIDSGPPLASSFTKFQHGKTADYCFIIRNFMVFFFFEKPKNGNFFSPPYINSTKFKDFLGNFFSILKETSNLHSYRYLIRQHRAAKETLFLEAYYKATMGAAKENLT